jgi:hypothetical protein
MVNSSLLNKHLTHRCILRSDHETFNPGACFLSNEYYVAQSLSLGCQEESMMEGHGNYSEHFTGKVALHVNKDFPFSK